MKMTAKLRLLTAIVYCHRGENSDHTTVLIGESTYRSRDQRFAKLPTYNKTLQSQKHASKPQYTSFPMQLCKKNGISN